MPVVCHRH